MDKLKRSNSDKVFSGVCGGLGELFNIDPTIVRIIWALFSLRYFTLSVLVYIACSLIIPIDNGIINEEDYNYHNYKIRKNAPLIIGVVLVVWGIVLLSQIIFPWFTLRMMSLVKYWPALLIVLGIYIIFSQTKNK